MKCVFESAVAELADPNAVIDVIGIGTGATEVVEYLQQNWGLWKGKVAAVCVGTSYVWPGEEIWDREFGEFWAKVRPPLSHYQNALSLSIFPHLSLSSFLSNGN